MITNTVLLNIAVEIDQYFKAIYADHDTEKRGFNDDYLPRIPAGFIASRVNSCKPTVFSYPSAAGMG
jgi:hypothetical protein